MLDFKLTQNILPAVLALLCQKNIIMVLPPKVKMGSFFCPFLLPAYPSVDIKVLQESWKSTEQLYRNFYFSMYPYSLIPTLQGLTVSFYKKLT